MNKADGFSIGFIAKLAGVSVATIHSWEKQSLIPRAKRTASGHRRYSWSDVQAVEEYLSSKIK